METGLTMNINTDDDGVRSSLQRILQQKAETSDYSVVRTYLRDDAKGRQVVLSAMRSATTDNVLRRVLPIGDTKSGASALTYEIFAARADAMFAELVAECATSSERLVAQQVVDAWVRLEYVQSRYDNALQHMGTESMRFWDRMLSRSSQRYLRALETLSRIRRYELQVVDRMDADGSQQRSVALRASS